MKAGLTSVQSMSYAYKKKAIKINTYIIIRLKKNPNLVQIKQKKNFVSYSFVITVNIIILPSFLLFLEFF